MFMSVLLLIALNNCIGCENAKSKDEQNPKEKLDSNSVSKDSLNNSEK